MKIEQYNPFLGTFLGTGHLVYCEYKNAYKLVFRHWMTFIKKFNMCYGNTKVGPMLIVWFFHFYIYGCLQDQHNSVDKIIPHLPLVEEVKKFLLRKKVHKFVPPFNNVPVLDTFFCNASNAWDNGNPGGSGGGTPGGGGRGNPGSRGNPGGNSLGAQVHNRNADSHIQDNKALRTKIQNGTIKSQTTRLERDNPAICAPVGTHSLHCLYWNIKGFCYGICKRTADHVQLVGTNLDEIFTYAQSMFQ